MDDPSAQPEGNSDDLRQIPRWGRRYSDSRVWPLNLLVLAVAVSLVPEIAGVFLLVHLKYSPISLLGLPLFVLSAVIGQILLGLFLVYALGGIPRLAERVDAMFYGRDGTVLPVLGAEIARVSAGRKLRRLYLYLWWAIPFFLGCLVVPHLHLPPRFEQPMHALMWVPIALFTSRYPDSGFRGVYLTLPLLYGIHAVLLIAGVPLYLNLNKGDLGLMLHDSPVSFNVILSFLGCLLLFVPISHSYNRYSLRRLRRLSLSPEVVSEEAGPHA